MPDAAEPLSPQAADLVRRIARKILDEPADLMDQVHTAVKAAADEPLRSDPVLAAEVAASTRSNVLHWVAGIARDPGGRVPANLTPEVLGIAREAFRRGIEQAVYTTATRSSTGCSAPNGCSRSRWPATASKLASPLRSRDGSGPNPAASPMPGDVRIPGRWELRTRRARVQLNSGATVGGGRRQSVPGQPPGRSLRSPAAADS